MKLKIITQERVVFDEEVDEIYSVGTDGEFGILKGHIPMMTALAIGVTRAKQGDNFKMFTTMGGILQFKEQEMPSKELEEDFEKLMQDLMLKEQKRQLQEQKRD